MQVVAPVPVTNVDEAVEREGNLISTINRLEAAIQDYNAPSLGLEAVPVDSWDRGMSPWARGVIQARQAGSEAPVRLNILRGAHQQIANKLDIPFKYYQRMLERHSYLWAQSVNTWLHENNKKRLLRLLLPMDEAQERFAAETNTQFNLRAFLSDRYHIIDHKALVDTILPILRQHDAYVTGWNLDEQHFHIRFATQEIEILEQFYEEQPGLRGMHEIVAFGGALRNSETGHGAFTLGPAVNITRCVNVLVHTDKMRIVHLGGRSTEEEGFFERDTKAMDDSATILKVRDRLRHVFSPESNRRIASTIAEKAGTPFVIPDEVHYIEFIGNIGKQFKLSDEESRIFQNEFVSEAANTGRVLDNNSDRAPTRWTIAQAMTATARVVNDRNPEMDFDRREEMETLGWEILTSPTSRLLKAAKAATN